MKKSLGIGFIAVCYFVVIGFMCLPTAVQAATKTEIVIGANTPLTGALSQGGLEQKWAYEQCVKDVNAKGGIFVKEYNKKLPVRLVFEDGESDPGKAAAAVDRLAKVHKVDLMLSSWGTPIVLTSCVAAEKLKIYYHGTNCIPDPWREKKFKWSTMYFFNASQSASVPFKLLDSLPAAERPKNLALVLEESADSRAMGPMWKSEAKKAKYAFSTEETFPVGTKDFAALILKLKSKGIDGAVMFAGDEAVTFLRQTKEAGLNLKFWHCYKGALPSSFWDALGKDAQYAIADGWWDEEFPYPMAKELGQRFFVEYKRVSKVVGSYYTVAQTLFEAIEKAGTLDSAKVRQAVLSTHFKNTVMGDVKYDKDGVAYFRQGAFQWQDGHPMLVYPFELTKGYKLKVAPPWNNR